jgi:hypothetical protein
MTPELIERLESAAALPTGLYAEAATQGAADNARIASLQAECDMWCSKANERQLRIGELKAKLVERTADREAGRIAGMEQAAEALEADALTCDCFAHSEGECACGAWCEWKSITSARAVEIVRAAKEQGNG